MLRGVLIVLTTNKKVEEIAKWKRLWQFSVIFASIAFVITMILDWIPPVKMALMMNIFNGVSIEVATNPLIFTLRLIHQLNFLSLGAYFIHCRNACSILAWLSFLFIHFQGE